MYRDHRAVPYLFIVILGVVWGLTFSLARLATEAGGHPLGLALWQALGGGLVMLSVCAIRRSWPPLSALHALRYVLIGLLGTAVPGTILFFAAPHVPAGLLAITIALIPLTTYAASALLSIEKWSVPRLSGVLLGFAAILFLMLPQSSLPSQTVRLWLLLALVAVLFYTLENLFVDNFLPVDTDMVHLLTGGMLAAACMLTPIVIVQNAFVSLGLPFGIVEWSVVSMSFVSSTAYLMYLLVIKMAGAVFASLAGYIITLSGVFWGVVFFAEKHSTWIWAALVLIFTGMVLVTPRDKKPS